jgi:L-2-hydroxyglutarate oxidase LhgO
VPPPSAAAAKSHSKRVADFIIECDPEFPSVVQLMGIESPGLTSAPAIAEHVSELLS